MSPTTTCVAIWRNAFDPATLHVGDILDRDSVLANHPDQAEYAVGDAVPLMITSSHRDDEPTLPGLAGTVVWVSAALLLRIPDAPTLRTVADAWHTFNAVPDSDLADDLACAIYAAEELELSLNADAFIPAEYAVRVITWVAAV